MQSSYSLIKKGFAKEGKSKVISTEYVSKKPVLEEFEEINGEADQIKVPQIDPEELLKKYEDIGQRIIEDAKREKQAIALRAQMEANASEK
jgi:flagellar assembly protein FliH